MLGAQLVLFGRFSCSNQVAQSFMLRIRDPYRRQISGLVGPRQPFSVTPIGLDPITRLHRHERRRDHFALHAQLGQLPISA